MKKEKQGKLDGDRSGSRDRPGIKISIGRKSSNQGRFLHSSAQTIVKYSKGNSTKRAYPCSIVKLLPNQSLAQTP